MSIPQLVGCAIALYVGWRLLRSTAHKSPLNNLPGPESESFISGNVARLFDRHEGWTYQRALMEKFGQVFAIYGLFNSKWIYTFDPRALHSIFVKDQDVYEESEIVISSFGLFIGPGLPATLGEQHRRQRKMLNPLFSAKHLRDMTPMFSDVVHRLETALAPRVEDGTQELDILGWMGRTALELIGRGGLGYSFDPLTDDVANELADALKAFFPAMSDLPLLLRLFLPALVRLGPAGFRRKFAEILPYRPAQRMRQISDALYTRSQDIINRKKAALAQGDEALKRWVGEGKDIMSVLLRENMAAAEEDRLPDEEVVGQVSTLVLAAMDTTSGVLARILHLLSLHQEIQQKLREELIRARDDGTGHLRDLDYDEVMELPYLDAICRETLRRYPPVTGMVRVVRKEAVLPLSAPVRGRDGSLIESIPVHKGMQIFADILASNCSKELWGEDGFEWRPERWLSPLPRAVEEAHLPGVYSHLMTFIGGSRACIGFKFAQLEMKVVLATLIPAFNFELSDKPIFWNAGAVAYPTVGKESTKPDLPLRVTALKRQ